MAQHPVARIHAESFGPFQNVDAEFSPSLNVIVGDNSTGKSHLLKLIYSCTQALKSSKTITKKEVGYHLTGKLRGTFRPDSLGRLANRVHGKSRAQISIKYAQIGDELSFGFSTGATQGVQITSTPTRSIDDQPVYLPPHELLSLSAGFLGLYDEFENGFDETWRDTVELLLKPAVKGARGKKANALHAPFADLLQGGVVVEKNGRFYLKQPAIGTLEAPLLAEGHRKLAMIIRLIANGSLLEGGYLFWDEPEANLNPASQRAVASALVHLANAGVQVFVASHSTFLIREIEMNPPNGSPRFIGLMRADSADTGEHESVPSKNIRGVYAQSSTQLQDLAYVAAIDAEAEQAGRYLAW